MNRRTFLDRFALSIASIFAFKRLPKSPAPAAFEVTNGSGYTAGGVTFAGEDFSAYASTSALLSNTDLWDGQVRVFHGHVMLRPGQNLTPFQYRWPSVAPVDYPAPDGWAWVDTP